MKNRGDYSNPQAALERMAEEARTAGEPTTEGPTFEDGQPPGPCRVCGKSPARVESYMYVMSFLFFTRWKNYPDLLCRDCSTSTALREQAKSAFLGWWGIPWGLMTFKALWVNGRTLARWSRIPALPAVAVSLLALAVPGGLVYLLTQGGKEQQQARATGDWVDEEVVRLMDSGHAKLDEGDAAGALAIYQRAHAKAPESSVINFSVGHAHFELGQHEQALPYLETAARRNPEDPTTAAVRTLILLALGREVDPASVALLERSVPQTAVDAYWLGSAFYGLENYEQVLRVSEAGLSLEPGHFGFALGKIEALIELGGAREARDYRATLADEMTGDPQFAFLNHLVELELQPMTTMQRLTAGWFDDDWTADSMKKVVAAARRSGSFEQVRGHVRDWLFADSTPPAAWSAARPWFEDEWTSALDSYLARRTAFEPGYYRLQEMDARQDSAAMVRLARRLGELDHPDVFLADLAYLEALSYEVPPEEFARLADRHAAARPDHVYCRYNALRRQTIVDPAARLAALEDLRGRVEDEGLARAIVVDRYELNMIQGHAADALSGFEATLPHGGLPYYSSRDLELLAAEAAFHARDMGTMLGHLQSYEAELDDATAAGHLLRWAAQLAAGQGLSYRQDVDQWLAEHGESALDSQSASAQAILVAEGRRPLAEARRAVAYRAPGTFELVALIRDAAESGRTDLDRLGTIAASEDAGEYGPRLARTIAERLGSRSERLARAG